MAGVKDAERVLSAEVEAELLQHPGKYVAVTFDSILAIGDSLGEVLAAAREKTDEVPLLFRVPADHDRAYFF